MIGLGLLGISGKTPFASIGQRALDLLEGHPWFEIRALIADDPEHAGKPAGECMTWYGPQDLPDSLADMTLMPADPEALGKVGDIKLVISAIPPWVDTKVDTIFPESNIPLLTERNHK
jgi:aspartate-semialdehyde dehydrogenase